MMHASFPGLPLAPRHRPMGSDSSEESLPESVSSGSGAEALPPDAEPLPSQDETGCCKHGCLAALEESATLQRRVTEMHQSLDSATKSQKEILQFHFLKEWGCDSTGHWRRYKAWNMPLCQKAVLTILKLSLHKMQKLNKQIQSGALQPEQPLQATQQQRQDLPGTQKADTCLSWLYHNVAEDLAENIRLGDEGTSAPSTNALPKAASIAYYDRLEDEESGVRWMPPGTTLAEMMDCAVTFLPHCRVSYSKFVTHYHMKWAKRLKIRVEGQHSKCTACEKFKAYRKQVTVASDCKRVSEEYTSHLKDVQRDREVDRRLCVRAAICSGALTGMCSEEDSLLSISIDAMDAAKFRVPRNISAAKEFQNLWRPELTMIGAIAEGLFECYFICDPDLCKNADLHCTILGHVLEKAREEFQARGRPWPHHLRLQTDNATAEGKNQTVFLLASWLVWRRVFKSVSCTQFRVGHTHGKIDQRFSEVRSVLSQCSVLEDPDAFRAALLTGMTPREHRHLLVERIQAAAGFRQFFESMTVKVSGHTQTKKKTENNEEAVHVFSFTRREGNEDEVPEVDDASPEGSDVILRCRQYLSDRELSQKPCVFAKSADFSVLPTSVHTLSARTSFSTRQAKEFNKTATAISAPPWSMHAGCAYLLKLLCENHENQSDDWVPPKMTWLLQGQPDDQTAPAASIEPLLGPTTFDWNHTTPAPVTVSRPPAKMRRLKVKQPCKDAVPGPAAAPDTPGLDSAVEAGPQDTMEIEPDTVDEELPPDAEPEDVEMAAPPARIGNDMAGAPQSMYGTGGAPPNVVPSHSKANPAAKKAKAKPKTQAKAKPKTAAKAKPKAKGKAKAAGKAKATAKAKAAPKARGGKRLGCLPMPADAAEHIGCCKCRGSSVGCARCRGLAGLVLNEDGTAWVWKDEDQ